jgi:hypothetical protein
MHSGAFRVSQKQFRGQSIAWVSRADRQRRIYPAVLRRSHDSFADIMPAEDTSDEAMESESMKIKAICLW